MEIGAASFVPSDPVRLLVLAHGYPWPDGSATEDQLAAYAQASVDRWAAFAEQHRALVVAPVFGGRELPGYRELAGRPVRPDQQVNALVDELGGRHVPGFSGRFSLHGHSAGAQFAARYLVTHPSRLDAAVLSAPSTFPMPDPATPWPNGMGQAADGFTPDPAGWLVAATATPVTVLVGSADTALRPLAPGQLGSTRIERATGWVEHMARLAEAAGQIEQATGEADHMARLAEAATRIEQATGEVDHMGQHAGAAGRTGTVQLVLAESLAHDEAALARPAQNILAREWAR